MSRISVFIVVTFLAVIVIGGTAGYLSGKGGREPVAPPSQVGAPLNMPSEVMAAPAKEGESLPPSAALSPSPAGRAERVEKYGPDWLACSDLDQLLARVSACERLLEHVPLTNLHRAWTYNNLGAAHMKLDRLVQAGEAFKQAIELEPRFVYPYNNLVDIALGSRRAQDALQIIQQAESRTVVDLRLTCQKAQAMQMAGNLDAASHVLANVPPADAEKVCVLRGRSEILLARGETDAALALLQSDKTDPVSASILQCRAGEILRYADRLKEAYDAYSRGIELDPKNKCAVENAGGLVYRVLPPDQALAWLEDAIERYPDIVRLQCQKGAALEENDWHAALGHYEAVIAKHPNELCSLRQRADLMFRMGNPEDAVDAFDQLLQIGSRDPMVWSGRGRVLLWLGRFDDAQRDFDQALELNPYYTEPLMLRGEVLFLTRRYDQAIADFTRVIQLSPEYRPAQSFLADAMFEAGRHEEALSLCRALLEENQTDGIAAQCRLQMGRAFLKANRPVEAVRELTAAVAQAGKGAEANLYLAAVNLFAGDLEDARAALLGFRSGRPDDLYGAIWSILLQPEGAAVPEDVLALAEKRDVWPFPVLRFLLGEIDAADLMTETEVPDFNLAVARRAEAEFYMALKQILSGESEAALAAMKRLQSEQAIALRRRDYPALYKHSNRLELTIASWLTAQ